MTHPSTVFYMAFAGEGIAAEEDVEKQARSEIDRVPDNGTTEFVYDGLGRRVKTIEKESSGTPYRTRQYIYDGLDMIAELNSSGGLVAAYTHGPGIDNPISVRLYAGGGSTEFFYHKNHLGSITRMTDMLGRPAKAYQYDAYGAILAEQGPSLVDEFAYTARRLHDRSGLYYYRARFYSPEIGRFITQDPIGMLGGTNLYAYVGNDPVNMIDPWGLKVYHHGEVVNEQMQKALEGVSEYSGYDIHITEDGGTRNEPGDRQTSQHYTGNAADFYMMTPDSVMVNMATAAHTTMDYGKFTGIGYYSGAGKHGAHIHADLRQGQLLYWSETDERGYLYNEASEFWQEYFKAKKNNACEKKGAQ